jgi:Fe-S-cluster containining protein
VDRDLDAGEFSSWLAEMQGALRGENDANVPCDGCTACCTSSQFVHVEPDETDALAHIPSELLFPAPGLPRGHVLMGYDERGHCPMFVDGGCSIYAHRPRACRVYDCRVFAATGVELDDRSKSDITARVARWRFRYDSPAARAEHDALCDDARHRNGAATERALAAVRSRTRD